MSELNQDDPRRLHALMQDHARKLRQLQVNGYKRIGFSVGATAILAMVLFVLPRPYALLLELAVVAFVVWALWSLRPGRCAVCGKVTGIAVPQNPPFVPHAWWDLRPYPRKDFIHVCPEHFLKFISARVRRNNRSA